MRVAQIIDGLRRAGGAERLQQTLALALRPHDIELTIITIGADEMDAVRDMEALGIRVVRFPASKFLDPMRALRLRRFLAAERFDVVHTHLVRSTVLGAATARSVGTPVVATIHSAQRNPRLSRAMLALEVRALTRWANRVIAVGWKTADAHRDRLPGVHIDILPNAVHAPEPIDAAARRKIRDELGVDDQTCLCIGVGRLAPAKNFPLAIDAFAELVAVAPSARLVIVGDGNLRPMLEEQVETLGIQQHVQFLGLRMDVDRLLASSDVYISSSDYEGLPLATLEAMHAGLPVVATKVGDVPRVVTPETGRLVDKGDRSGLARELAGLVEDEGLRAALGEAGRARALSEFGVEKWGQAHESLYEDLAGRSRPARADGPEEGASCVS